MPTLRPGPRLATRLAFVVAGFISACWAPLIPFAKARLGVDDGQLGLILLAFGIGSLVGVTSAGVIAARIGSRPVILAGGLGMSLMLPLLAVAPTALTLCPALAVLGASLGALDVAMNTHGAEVETAAGVPLMSGFHALYSLGGFAGAAWMTGCLAAHLSSGAATLGAAALGAILTLAAGPGLLRVKPQRPAVLFAMPTGLVVVIALLAATMFLVEGAMFDWSALLLVDRHVASAAGAGIGFSCSRSP
jgi:predicted MFS family arabinose efflux permease